MREMCRHTVRMKEALLAGGASSTRIDHHGLHFVEE
jgi:hypothetical protein